MIIRKARENDIDGVNATYTELFDYEDIHGSTTNWVRDQYPCRATAERAFANDWLYVAEEDGKIVASMIVNHEQPEEYSCGDWLLDCPKEKTLVIHTLCAAPSVWGRGIGKRMVNYVINLAIKTGCESLRHDTEEHNAPADAMYLGMGFRHAGLVDAMFQGFLPRKLWLFELVLPKLELVNGHDEKPAILELFKEYTDYLVENDKKFAAYLEIQNYDDELRDLTVKYGEPDGRLHLAKVGGEPIGCVALKRHDDTDSGELKRMYIRPTCRGRGYSRVFVERIIADAREIGYDALYLDTLPFLVEAQGLYKSMGFEICEPYNDDPMGCSIFMRRELNE